MAKKILLIEDAPQVANILVFKLNREGHEVTWTRDREKGLAALASAFDLILLSTYLLPERNAWETLADLKARTTTPVVMLLENEEAHLEGQAVEKGAIAVILKPFKPTVVAKRVRDLLERGTAPLT